MIRKNREVHDMELPKNITQIGEADRHCKIYVEDYVISYIRQMNHQAADKKETLALYGRRQEEGEIAYLFIYGACRMTTLSGQVRHLSQAQLQEAEKQKRLYFPEDMFLGYSLLNGEMVEGFYILEQGICRYVAGYACFYEKNDSMLAYMLDSRKEEAKPEQVDNEKYERVRQRQEETRQQYRQQTGKQDAGKQTADGSRPKKPDGSKVSRKNGNGKRARKNLPGCAECEGMRRQCLSFFVRQVHFR